MAHDLTVPDGASREERYAHLLPQLSAVLEGEPDLTARMANTAAVLKQGLGFFWVGFYVLKDGELVVGPFQGPPACSRIAVGRGVCGAVAQRRETLVVPDVEAFPGHIACSSQSRSEVVVPLLDAQGGLVGVLDVDSDRLDDFHDVDRVQLERVTGLVVGGGGESGEDLGDA